MQRLAPLGAALLTLASAALADDPNSTLVSVGTNGGQGSGGAGRPAFSGYGFSMAFLSFSDDLVPGDSNGRADVFVRDFGANTTQLVSLGVGGVQGNQDPLRLDLSWNGQLVAWGSLADNLVPGDTNNVIDIFARQLSSGVVERISVASSGAQANFHSTRPAASTTGRYVAFESGATNLVAGVPPGVTQIYLRDRVQGTTELVSRSTGGAPANANCGEPTIGGSGRYVAYSSIASNLVTGDTNGSCDIFVLDRVTGVTTRVSLAPGGVESNGSDRAPQFAEDGLWLAFESTSDNFVAGDTNGVDDVYVLEVTTGAITRASVTSGGTESAGICTSARIAMEGRQVAFAAELDDLDAGDTNGVYDIYVKDLWTGRLTLMSRGPNGQLGNWGAGQFDLSSNGTAVAFTTNSTNFLNPDLNGFEADVFRSQCEPLGLPYCGVFYNSIGEFAFLEVRGSDVASDADLTLSAVHLPPDQPGYFLAGQTQGSVDFPAGSQGRLCLQGVIARFSAQVASSGSHGYLEIDVATQAIPTTPAQPILAGQTWSFQAWYRDVNPTPTSNFAQPVAITFQ